MTIANGSDFDDFAGLEYRAAPRFRITHAGCFFGKRDPRPFLQALADSGLDIVARFVGDFRTADREWAEALGLGDRLELIPYAPRAPLARAAARLRGAAAADPRGRRPRQGRALRQGVRVPRRRAADPRRRAARRRGRRADPRDRRRRRRRPGRRRRRSARRSSSCTAASRTAACRRSSSPPACATGSSRRARVEETAELLRTIVAMSRGRPLRRRPLLRDGAHRHASRRCTGTSPARSRSPTCSPRSSSSRSRSSRSSAATAGCTRGAAIALALLPRLPARLPARLLQPRDPGGARAVGEGDGQVPAPLPLPRRRASPRRAARRAVLLVACWPRSAAVSSSTPATACSSSASPRRRASTSTRPGCSRSPAARARSTSTAPSTGQDVYRPNALTGDPNHLGIELAVAAARPAADLPAARARPPAAAAARRRPWRSCSSSSWRRSRAAACSGCSAARWCSRSRTATSSPLRRCSCRSAPSPP